MKELKYYVFKFRLKKNEEFCEGCNLIDTHLLILGKSLTWREKEMQYALDQFLNKFDGHDISKFCFIQLEKAGALFLLQVIIKILFRWGKRSFLIIITLLAIEIVMLLL